MLLEDALKRPVQIVGMIDNMQTIQVVTKGYSKKLRHLLPRMQRICIGVLHEMISNPDVRMCMEHCPTLKQKANIFTKTLAAAKFAEARAMIGIA